MLQYSLNFVKKPVSECPVATWSTPKPSNETFVESKWKHRPLLAIDLDDISIIEPQAGTVRLNRDIQVIPGTFEPNFHQAKNLGHTLTFILTEAISCSFSSKTIIDR